MKVILGGPFLPHIEDIIRAKAFSMCSPVMSASDSGNKSRIRGFSRVNAEPSQSCDILIQIDKDEPSSIELHDVHLSMLGHHQLQNALTATCAALCLRDQGWRISDSFIRTALENTQLLGRSQFLKKEDTEALGIPSSMALLDGAHTQESAKALADTISMACQGSKLVAVVAMASDKDHLGFARALLSGLPLEAVFLTEVNIAGDKCRTASALLLKDSWSKVCMDLGIEFVHIETIDNLHSLDASVNPSLNSSKLILTADSSIPNCLKAAHRILKARTGEQSGMIVVTGSLHIVSSVLDSVGR